MYVFDRGVAIYYVDPDGGSDANAGNSPDSPMQTIPAAVAKTKTGDWVLLRRGSRFFDRLIIPQPYRRFGTYGQGVMPIIDGSLVVPGPWVQHGEYSNVWYSDVSLSSTTGGDYSVTTSSAWHPALWDEADTDTNESATVLRRLRSDGLISSSATQDQMLSAVNSEPNTFCVFKQGSTHPEPRDASERGTEWRVYLHTRDGSNPNTNGRAVRIAEYNSVLIAAPGQQWHDIVFQRCGGKDMVGVSSGATKVELFRGCRFLEAAVHATVVGGATFENCRAVAHEGHTDAKSMGGGAFHQYRSDQSGTGQGFQVKDCYAKGFNVAVYTHGGPAIQHEHYDVSGLVAESCNCVLGGSSRRGIVAKSVTAKDCQYLCDSQIVIDDSELWLTSSIRRVNSLDTTQTLLRNCLVIGSQHLLDLGFDFSDPAIRPTLSLENCTVYTTTGHTGGPTDIRRKFNLSLKNSIVAGYQMIDGTVTKDADSTFEVIGTWGIDVAQQGYVHALEFTVTEDDVIWVDNPGARRVSWSGTDNGDGTASITVNFNDRNFGSWIRIPDGNGVGIDYQGRIISNGTNSSSPLIVSPVPLATFGNKIFKIPVFKHYLHRDAITGTVSENGLQIRVPDGRFFYPGNAIRVGNIGLNEYGLRYVASVSGNVITLDKPCEWKVRGDNIAYNSLDGTTTTDRRSLPTVEISFGFPIHKRDADAVEYPKITVTSPGGQVVWTEKQRTSSVGDFQNWAASETPRLGTRYSPLGTIRPNGQWNGGIQHELGYWDLGLAGMGIGDTVKFEFKVDVEEEKVRFDADPSYVRRYLPNKDSRPFQRQAGYRG